MPSVVPSTVMRSQTFALTLSFEGLLLEKELREAVSFGCLESEIVIMEW